MCERLSHKQGERVSTIMLLITRVLMAAVAVVSLFPSAITGLSPPFEEEQCPREPACCEEDCCGPGTSWYSPFCVYNSDSSGFNGTHSDAFDKGCVERACCEEDCCNPGFTEYDATQALCLPVPQGPPGPTPAPVDCMPTVGPCVSSFSELEQALAGATSNDVVALCGGDPIVTETAAIVDQPSLSLCCLGDLECSMESGGDHRNLEVTGSDFTAQGIIFANGKATAPDEAGGNVLIDAAGNHQIFDCTFQSGQASEGGNLAIKNAESVVMWRTVFAYGNTTGLGGGFDLDALENLIVDQCSFESNTAFSGAGFHVRYLKSISVKNSSFRENIANFGGGFFASGLGSLQSLEVLSSTFDENRANIGNGGAGLANLPDLSQLNITLFGNSGGGNFAAGGFEEPCDDFFFVFSVGEEGDDSCVDVNQDITSLPA